MSTPVGDGNSVAYSGIKPEDKVHSTYDKNKDAIVNKSEASSSIKYKESIFSGDKASAAVNAQVKQAINNSATLKAAGSSAMSVVQKYLGGATTSVASSVSNLFKNIQYTVHGLADGEFLPEASTALDSEIDAKITEQATTASTQLSSDINEALSRAIKSAESELGGDSDIIDGNRLRGREKSKQDLHARIENLRYKPSPESNQGNNDGMAQMAFYSSASGQEGAKQSVGYQLTTQYLLNNGAKEYTREVDGKKQTIYKIGGEHYIVDDSGQMHTLEEIQTFMCKNKYVTQEAAEELRGDNQDAKIRRRKVDGEYRAVVMTPDKQSASTIDYDEQSGGYFRTDGLTHVSAGGRAKFTSESSGLSAAVEKSSNDELQFYNGRVKTGTWQDQNGDYHDSYAMTQRSRAKLEDVPQAVSNLTTAIGNKGTVSQPDGNGIVTVQLNNGRTYTINTKDFKQADRTMRIITAQLGDISPSQGNNPVTPQQTVKLDNKQWSDGRTDANGVDQTEASTSGNTGVQWGVNGEHVSNAPSDIRSLKGRYSSAGATDGLTRSQFQTEGWTTDKNRTKEKAMIEKMDSEGVKGTGKSVRNLKNATEFAERFLKASGVTNPDSAKVALLAKALQIANPSIFDSSGNMYKNADFNRLNLPKNISRYS